jgi:hypothetical protein
MSSALIGKKGATSVVGVKPSGDQCVLHATDFGELIV